MISQNISENQVDTVALKSVKTRQRLVDEALESSRGQENLGGAHLLSALHSFKVLPLDLLPIGYLDVGSS